MRIGGLTVAALACGALALSAPLAAKRAAGPPIPPGWAIDRSAEGDLTGDGRPDSVVIIRQLQPGLVLDNSGLGEPKLDTNPRRLLVFERTAAGFRQIGAADRLVPAAGNTDTPCLVDPLEDGDLSIARQVLSVSMRFWLSCGGWGSTTVTYRFRREAARFRLIGFDRTEFMRNSGQGEALTVNFLTARKATAPYAIDKDGPLAWRWSRIRPQRHYLDTLDPASCAAIDAKTTLC